MPGSRKRGLLLLVFVALGLRLSVLWLLATEHKGPLTYEHGEIASHLIAGEGFSVKFLGREGPTSQQAPFYPLLLAGAYSIFGDGSPGALLAIKLLQAVAGTALVLCVAWLGWSLIPSRRSIGWTAAWGAAVYPTHVYMITHMQVGVWAALELALLLAVIAEPRWNGSWRRALSAGAIAGLLLLTEPILALALPVVGIMLWRRERSAAPGSRLSQWTSLRNVMRHQLPYFARVLCMAAIAAVVIAPWLWRNYRVHGEFVFMKSTFGYAFWQGNNPLSWGTDKIPRPAAEILRQEHDGTLADMDRALWEARHKTLYIDDVALTKEDYRELAALNEPGRSRLLMSRAMTFIHEHPQQYVKLCLKRLKYFLLFDETNPKAAQRLYRIATVIWLTLAFIGVLASRPYWHALWPTFAIFAVVTLFHTLTITSARFRIPLEPMTFVWAAAAVAPMGGRLWAGLRAATHRESATSEATSTANFGPRHGLKGPHHRLRDTSRPRGTA